MFSLRNLRYAVPRVLIALVVFVMIITPFIAELSHVKGRLTIGDTGKLNYAWFVNRVPAYIHWRGEPPGSGTPEHPTRKIFDAPAVYEFETPIQGTYPPWYDPSYWHEGLVLHFDLKQQLWRLGSNAVILAELFTRFPSSGLIIAFLLFCIIGTSFREYVRNVPKNWIVILPGATGLIMYSLLNVAWRLVSPFVVLLFLGIAAGVRVWNSNECKRLMGNAAIAMIAGVILILSTSRTISVANLIIGTQARRNSQWEVAEALNRIGIRPGDKVAFIGDSFFAYWARLARVRIVSEIPRESTNKFWSADRRTKAQVLNALADTGAKVVVTDEAGLHASTGDWQRIASTDYYLYIITTHEGKQSSPS